MRLLLLAILLYSTSATATMLRPAPLSELRGGQAQVQAPYEDLLVLVGKGKCSCRPGCKKNLKGYQSTLKGDHTQFITQCVDKGADQDICEGLTTPDRDDHKIFKCTYGTKAIHMVGRDKKIHENGFELAKILTDLKQEGVCVDRVDDWLRPPEYNSNVGSTSTRHLKGGAVDVMFCSKDDKEEALSRLCQLLDNGTIKGLGAYPSGAVHIDYRKGGQWGNPCASAGKKRAPKKRAEPEAPPLPLPRPTPDDLGDFYGA